MTQAEQRRMHEMAAQQAGGKRFIDKVLPKKLRWMAPVAIIAGFAIWAPFGIIALAGTGVVVGSLAFWHTGAALEKGTRNFVYGMFGRRPGVPGDDGPGVDGPAQQFDGTQVTDLGHRKTVREYRLADPQSQKYLDYLNKAYAATTVTEVDMIRKMTEYQPPGADTSAQAQALRGVINELGSQTSMDEVRALIDARLAPLDYAAAEVVARQAAALRPQRPGAERERQPVERSRDPYGGMGGPGVQQWIVNGSAGGMNEAGTATDIS